MHMVPFEQNLEIIKISVGNFHHKAFICALFQKGIFSRCSKLYSQEITKGYTKD